MEKGKEIKVSSIKIPLKQFRHPNLPTRITFIRQKTSSVHEVISYHIFPKQYKLMKEENKQQSSWDFLNSRIGLMENSTRFFDTSHMAIDCVQGSIGTSASFALRLSQAFFSSISLLFMSLGVGFYSYTAFCFLVTVMGLVIPWSFTLAILDGYSILVKCSIRQSGILLVIVIGDSVLSILTLAAASSTASIIDLLIRADESFCPPRLCIRYQISAAMAFLSWILSVSSSLSNLWLLPAL